MLYYVFIFLQMLYNSFIAFPTGAHLKNLPQFLWLTIQVQRGIGHSQYLQLIFLDEESTLP